MATHEFFWRCEEKPRSDTPSDMSIFFLKSRIFHDSMDPLHIFWELLVKFLSCALFVEYIDFKITVFGDDCSPVINKRSLSPQMQQFIRRSHLLFPC